MTNDMQSLPVADYNPTGLADYDGNPLIEALPKILSDEEVAIRLWRRPALPSELEHQLPTKLKVHAINRLKDVVIPMEAHLELEDEFSQMIRRGYVGRHPFKRDTTAMRHSSTLENVAKTGYRSTAANMTVIGMSGMGKTTAINSVTALYPQVITHRQYNDTLFIQTQIVWLKVECSHDGSLRGFCAAFFSAVDEALGSSEYKKIADSRRSIELLLQEIGRLCRVYYIGAIIIDEMQHLNARKSDREKLLNFFVSLTNDAGVPMVYIGTNAMLEIFSTVVRNARRATGMGMITFDRFSFDDDNWNLLLSQLWRYDWCGTKAELTQELKEKIYEHTQGNTDFLVKLLILAQRYALYSGDNRITIEALSNVYKYQMRLLHRAIGALKSNDPQLLLTFDDLMPAKDQIAQMMSFDISRKSRSADLSRLLNSHQIAQTEDRPETVEVKKAPTSQGAAEQLHKADDLLQSLIEHGWVKK